MERTSINQGLKSHFVLVFWSLTKVRCASCAKAHADLPSSVKGIKKEEEEAEETGEEVRNANKPSWVMEELPPMDCKLTELLYNRILTCKRTCNRPRQQSSTHQHVCWCKPYVHYVFVFKSSRKGEKIFIARLRKRIFFKRMPSDIASNLFCCKRKFSHQIQHKQNLSVK